VLFNVGIYWDVTGPMNYLEFASSARTGKDMCRLIYFYFLVIKGKLYNVCLKLSYFWIVSLLFIRLIT